ncbi:MAG: hypothetical protein QN130_12470 [Armatimonadota bacterium]|nr:hypothetical protein [Armatimonadota bacterium]
MAHETDLRPYLDLLRSPEFQEVVAALGEPARAELEAEVQRLFGQRGPTLRELLEGGQMTADQVRAELLRAGLRPADVEALIASGRLDIPTLTFPGEIASAFGPRGGIRHLSGPYALALAIAMQNMQRNAAIIQAKALAEAAQLAQSAVAASAHGGGGGGGGGGGLPPPPGERPPLPPFPVPPRPAGPSPWAALIGPAGSLAGAMALEWFRKWLNQAPPTPPYFTQAELEQAAAQIEDLVRGPAGELMPSAAASTGPAVVAVPALPVDPVDWSTWTEGWEPTRQWGPPRPAAEGSPAWAASPAEAQTPWDWTPAPPSFEGLPDLGSWTPTWTFESWAPVEADLGRWDAESLPWDTSGYTDSWGSWGPEDFGGLDFSTVDFSDTWDIGDWTAPSLDTSTWTWTWT